MSNHPDLKRLSSAYEERERRARTPDAYSLFNESHLFAIQQRQRQVLSLLKKAGLSSLAGCQVLEVGCGKGGVLAEFLAYGAPPASLHGLDLIHSRVVEARQKLPALAILRADGQSIPYRSRSFDCVLQFTAFSSVLAADVRQRIAREMLRVLKNTGIILWYDFWLNPVNAHTRGIRPREIRELFPQCAAHLRRVTLAPPLARRLVPFSWPLALLLEKLSILNTHYLALIRPVP